MAQIRRAEDAGVDIVRVSCPDQESSLALKDIVRQVRVPVVADIHFHYKRAIEAAQSGGGVSADQSGQYRQLGAGPRSGAGGAGP